MDELDRIPWKDLKHAYGSAEDVPELLRALRTASADAHGEESPLWHLYGNIWHQGTVYEATAYAVPFLIELAADRRTPDRAGILALLADIAKGHSYRSAHGDLLHEPDFEEKHTRELTWVGNAHAAVADGFDVFVEITKENTEVRFAAAHVLAQLPDDAEEVGAILRVLLTSEARSLYRAGLLLLLGQSGDQCEHTQSFLSAAVNDPDTCQQRAAALSIARLGLTPLPPGARDAIIAAFIADDLEESFEGLPWDAQGDIDPDELRACLDASDREQVADALISAIESGKVTDTAVSRLIDLLFPRPESGRAPALTPRDLSPLQLRAVRALHGAMKSGKRIFYGHFPSWGLPDTMPEWRILAGRPWSWMERWLS